MARKCIFSVIMAYFLFSGLAANAANFLALPIPARIGGSVTVDGVALTQTTDDGYTFAVTKQDSTAYVPAAEDADGLNSSDWYIIDIPIYDATSQAGGANPGDTAVLHVYKNGQKMTVNDPAGGQLTVGAGGSTTQINIVAVTPVSPSPPDPVLSFTITATAESHGSISPSGSVKVAQWSSMTFAITPDEGYTIAQIEVDGAAVGKDSSYTFGNINKDHTISATFTFVTTGNPVGMEPGPVEIEVEPDEIVDFLLNVTNEEGVDASEIAHEWLIYQASVDGRSGDLWFWTTNNEIFAYNSDLIPGTVTHEFDHNDEVVKLPIDPMSLGSLGLSAGDLLWYGYAFSISDITTDILQAYLDGDIILKNVVVLTVR